MALSPYGSGAEPGDLIEIFRGAYQHWALYIGGNEVIHLTTPDSGDSGSGSVMGHLVGTVKRNKIRDVVHKDRFNVNNLWDYKWEPRDCGVIVREACSMEGKRMRYSAVRFNCEHFVTRLRYGEEESRQVTTAALIGGGVVAVGLVAFAATLFGALLKGDDEEDETRGRRERRHRRRQQ